MRLRADVLVELRADGRVVNQFQHLDFLIAGRPNAYGGVAETIVRAGREVLDERIGILRFTYFEEQANSIG